MVDWKEHEHEDIETQEMVDPNCLNSLRNYGLLKLFLTLGVWAQLGLLRCLISIRDVNREFFMIRDQELEMETSNIYIIIRLSWRGELVNLYELRPIGESVTVLLAEHSPKALKSKRGKIEIMSIWDLMLRVFLFTINRVVGAQS